MKKARFVIVRHAESDKTIRRIHGGSGNYLTEQGERDIEMLTLFLSESALIPDAANLIYSSNVTQVKLTAELLGSKTAIPTKYLNSLQNIDMGVLAGLSDEEATQKFPDVMERLSKWRQGLLDVSDVKIPEAESLPDFVNRIEQVVRDSVLNVDVRNNIFIVTRSVGIAVMNILLRESYLFGKPYTRFRIDPCSTTLIDVEEVGKGDLIYLNRTDYLQREIMYHDD